MNTDVTVDYSASSGQGIQVLTEKIEVSLTKKNTTNLCIGALNGWLTNTLRCYNALFCVLIKARTMTKVPMTVAGAEQLREELNHLKGKERPEIINAIAEARAHGDLKENAEYHAAREQQGFVEGRIAEIEAKLSNAQVIDVKTMASQGKVIFGTTVTLINTASDESVTYQIVGDDESDIKQGKISVNTPIARAIIAKEEGDVVDVTTPAGVVEYEIDKIEFI